MAPVPGIKVYTCPDSIRQYMTISAMPEARG